MKTTRFWLATAIVSVVIISGFQFSKAANEKAAATAVVPQNTATTPVVHKGMEARIDKITARAKEGDVDLVFIGDSINQGWEGSGKEVWNKFYGERKAMNCGIGGDRTQHVLWRLDQGNIDGIHPKLAVIMIGTNNSNGNDNTAEEIGEGIKAIVGKVREKWPDTKILLLGIFPRGAYSDAQLEKGVMAQLKRDATKKGDDPEKIDTSDMPAKIAAAREVTMKQREKNAKASEIASKLADNKMIFYMDIGPKFMDAEGTTIPDDVMPDHLHPNAKGYEIWAEAIEPKVKELMGEKK
jgi:beta-glucosidase